MSSAKDWELCAHGIPYSHESCPECDRVWAENVTLPATRKNIADLLRFYSVQSLIELVQAQAAHVEKLQSKLPPAKDQYFKRVREG